MDSTPLLLTLVACLGFPSPGCWAFHSVISRTDSSDAETYRKLTRQAERPDVKNDSEFTSDHDDVEKDRRIQGKYYGPGYYLFPSSKGCGGSVEARPGYQYGQIVSPGWPMTYPSPISCKWSLHGFDHIVITITDLDLRGPKPVCNVDWVNVYIPRKSVSTVQMMCESDITKYERMLIAMDVDPLVSIDVTFGSKSSTHPERKGFALTWMKFPRRGFVTSLFDNQRPFGNMKLGYFVHVGSTNDVVKGNFTLILDVVPGHSILQGCEGFSATLVDYGLSTRHQLPNNCQEYTGPLSNSNKSETFAHLPIYSITKARAPWVIEITVPAATDIFLASSTLVPYPTATSLCTFLVGSDLSNKTQGVVLQTTDDAGVSLYSNHTNCGFGYGSSDINLWDAFIQVRAAVDVEESHSCMFDYFLVGGHRICGQEVKQLVSPHDNMILERVGARYVNVVAKDMDVDASPVQPNTCCPESPLNSDLESCYQSQNVPFSTYWMVELFDEYLVHGVAINTLPPTGTQVSPTQRLQVSFYLSDAFYGMMCWSGNLKSGRTNIILCSTPMVARSVKIRKTGGILSLCRVQVFINTVEPNLDPMNVAKGKRVWLTSGPLWAIGPDWSATQISDGSHMSCTLTMPITRPVITVDVLHIYRIFAVRIITWANNAQYTHNNIVPSFPREFNLTIYREDNKNSPAQICRWVLKVTRDNTLIPCRQPLSGRFVALEQRTGQLFICELFVYAIHDVLDGNNVALFKNGQTDSDNSTDHHPFYLDGDLFTCAKATIFLNVDLGDFHDVEGVIVSIGNKSDFPFKINILDHLGTTGIKQDCDGKDHLYALHLFETVRIICTLPRVGRYVMLSVEGYFNNEQDLYLEVCEMQVLAVPHDTPDTTEANVVNAALYKYAVFWPHSAVYNTWFSLSSNTTSTMEYGTARTAVNGVREKNTSRCGRSGHVEGLSLGVWTVDLANFFRVRIILLTMCSQSDAVAGYSVQIHTTSPLIFTTWNSLKGNASSECGHPSFDTVHGNVVGRSVCPVVGRGRYVAVAKMGILCLCEVQVLVRPLVSARRFGAKPTLKDGDTWMQNLNFSSDSGVTGGGLQISYYLSDLKKFKSFVDCGEMFVADNGTILSPNYPETYAKDYDNYVCQWMVSTLVDGFTVVWVESLSLAIHPVYPDICFADILVIGNQAGQQLTLCGDKVQESFSLQSFKNEYLFVTLMVRTPEDIRLSMSRSGVSGFRIRFQSYPSCSMVHIALPAAGNANSRIFSSPFYPEGTPPNAVCHWILQPPSKGLVLLHFRDFNIMGEDQNCSQAAVSISSRTLVEVTYCNENPPDTGHAVAVTEKDKVEVTFRSYKGSHGRGFQMAYHFSKEGQGQAMSLIRYCNCNVSEQHSSHTCCPQERTSTRSASSGREITTRLPATYTFSSLTNAGQIVLSLPYIPASERNGNCLKYVSIQRENVHTGNKFNFSETCSGTYDVSPFTVWTFDFKLADLDQQQMYTFIFSFRIADSTGQGKAFVGHMTKVTTFSRKDVVSFSNISLQSNLASDNDTGMYIPESGLYLITIRGRQSIQLFVNNRPKFVIAYTKGDLYRNGSRFVALYAGTGTVSSVTGVLKLYKGDRLSVRILFTRMLDKYAMFSAVYVSPIQGGYAFLGQEEQPSQVPFSGASLNFRSTLTSVGNIYHSPDFTSFRAPETGIYWIAMRARDGNGDLPNLCYDGWCSMKTFLTYRHSLLLKAVGYNRLPSETSGAFYFERNLVFSVSLESVSETVTGSIFSFVYLSFNRKPHTSKFYGLAFTALASVYCYLDDSGTPVQFHQPIVNLGGMFNSGSINYSTIHIPLTGLYLVVLRPYPREQTSIILEVHVNNRVTWTAMAENGVPIGQTTVLRLAAGDSLWVSVADCSGSRQIECNILISVAFAHP